MSSTEDNKWLDDTDAAASDSTDRDDILRLALSIFGSEEKANRWLNKPKARFDGRSPLDMLTSKSGASRVNAMLHQIRSGISF
ncbi:hypothetical protein AFAE65S_00126 [Alcaligenes phenolicus]